MVQSKKAISPVVATALLLVVAVVAVVGFQTWFTTYQSGLQVKAEQDSGASLTVERVETDGTVFIKNSGATAVTLAGSGSKITFGTNSSTVPSCVNASGTIAASTTTEVTHQSGTPCNLTAGTSYQIVMSTSSGTFSSENIAR